MAVQTQYIAHSFPHDPRATTTARSVTPTTSPTLDVTTTASVFLGEPPGAGDLLAGAVFSDLTVYNDGDGYFAPTKRAGLTAMEGQRALLPPVLVPLPQAFAPAGNDVQAQGRLLCTGAASTSGRPAPASHGLLSHLYRHCVEVDAIVRIENERLRAGLQEARRRHVRAVVSAMERTAARRLRIAEVGLERALARNAELDEKLRQMGAEGQAWQGIARSHEAAAAGLRATLDQVLQTPCAGAEAEDARSCCDGHQEEEEEDGMAGRRRACMACCEADACVVVLPCRHLCLCAGCDGGAEACPVCEATKNASLHVLLPLPSPLT